MKIEDYDKVKLVMMDSRSPFFNQEVSEAYKVGEVYRVDSVSYEGDTTILSENCHVIPIEWLEKVDEGSEDAFDQKVFHLAYLKEAFGSYTASYQHKKKASKLFDHIVGSVKVAPSPEDTLNYLCKLYGVDTDK